MSNLINDRITISGSSRDGIKNIGILTGGAKALVTCSGVTKALALNSLNSSIAASVAILPPQHMPYTANS